MNPMEIETKRSVDPLRLPTMTTDEIRRAFLVEGLFTPGETRLVAWELDRTIVGSVVPTRAPLSLGHLFPGNGSFADRRELGILNIGGPGVVSVGGETHQVRKNDGLYVGLGAGEVVFGSSGAQDPARFYLLSHPAHSSTRRGRSTGHWSMRSRSASGLQEDRA
jgi:4-deoxy-L-threo-5-hexosulose-uronate ketol-isomerase